MTDNTTALTKPIGTPGLAQWSGYIDDDFDRRLRARRRPETFREMAEGSSTIGALLYSINALVQQAGHRIEAADESPDADAAKVFIEECISDLDGAWADTLSEILSALPYGFSLMEIVYKLRRGETGDPRQASVYTDGKIGWARWAPRAQETIIRWAFDDSSTAVAAYQQAPPRWTETMIPLDRCLHFRVQPRKNNPEGRSLIRNAFESWYYFKHISRIEAIGIERDLAGLPVVRIPTEIINAGGSNLASWDQIATSIRRDEQAGLRLPSDRDESGNYLYDVSLLTTGGTRQIDTDPILARYERLMLRSVLADFLTQGDQGVGSFAQSVSRIDLFLSSVTAILESFADVLNIEIRRLIKLNGMNPDLCPTFIFNDLSRKDMTGFVTAVVALAGAGFIDSSDPDIRQHVADELGLPMPIETDEQQAEQGGEPIADEQAQPDPNATPDQKMPPEPVPQAKKASEPIDLDAALQFFRSRAKTVSPDLAGVLDAEAE